MQLNKISVLLCLGMQESEGPFSVCVISENKKEFLKLSRNEIKNLSDGKEILSIDIVAPIKERRWWNRGTKDRRKDER